MPPKRVRNISHGYSKKEQSPSLTINSFYVVAGTAKRRKVRVVTQPYGVRTNGAKVTADSPSSSALPTVPAPIPIQPVDNPVDDNGHTDTPDHSVPKKVIFPFTDFVGEQD